jgi:hypothetical protein
MPAQLIFTAGEHHDLRVIFDELNARYFDSRIDAAITWGARSGRARRRNSIKMGSYSVEDRLIRIHRSLDRVFVPRFFVEWIVFHEMLHQVHASGRTGAASSTQGLPRRGAHRRSRPAPGGAIPRRLDVLNVAINAPDRAYW